MQAAVGWISGVVAERFWNGGSHTTCHCEFSGPEPGSGVLQVLREQLGRCGPEHLQAPTCPSCPLCPSCPEGPSPQRDLLLAGLAAIVGIAVGVLATLGCWACSTRRSTSALASPAPKTPSRALAIQGHGQVRDGFEPW